MSEPRPSLDVLGSDQHRELAREVAARSAVLLRNENVDGPPVLPLQTDARVAVFGRLADQVNLGDGGSSDVWDLDCVNVLDSLRQRFGEVEHDDGTDLDRAATTAANADVAIVVAGYTYLDEGEYIGATDPALRELFPAADEPDVVDRYQDRLAAQVVTTKPTRLDERPAGFSVGGDRSSLRLTDHDVALIRAVARVNARTVVAIQAGSAVIVDEWIDEVPAIVQSWYGGCQAGPGLTDVLVGAVNPSARLPFSVPTTESDLPPFDRDATTLTYDRWHGWWHLARHGHEPRFPFGFGLSYTSFELVDSDVTVDGETLTVSATVRNTGDRDGADVIQIYATLPDPDAPPRLVGFQRIDVSANTTAKIEATVRKSRLATRDPNHHTWREPSGNLRITVSRSAHDADAHRHQLML